jgi:hypothetical protein
VQYLVASSNPYWRSNVGNIFERKQNLRHRCQGSFRLAKGKMVVTVAPVWTRIEHPGTEVYGHPFPEQPFILRQCESYVHASRFLPARLSATGGDDHVLFSFNRVGRRGR